MTLTDCQDLVLDRLKSNVFLNNAQCNIVRYDWNHPSKYKCDVILGADIVYDPDLIDPLCKSLDLLINSCTKCFLAFTIRRLETIHQFLSRLNMNHRLLVTEITFTPDVNKFYFDEGRESVKLYEIKMIESVMDISAEK